MSFEEKKKGKSIYVIPNKKKENQYMLSKKKKGKSVHANVLM